MKNNKFSKFLKNGGFFVIVVAITFKLLFLNTDFNDIINAVSQVNLIYIAMGAVAMVLMIICEAVNIKRSLFKFKVNTTFLQCIQFSFAGVFFSSITPAASGGQPMQIYYMHKKKINVSNAILALLICLATYQFVAVAMAVVSLIFKFSFFKETLGGFSALLYLGIVMNTVLLILILVAIFSKKLIFQAVTFVVNILRRFNPEKAEAFEGKALIEIERYKKGAGCVKKDKLFMINTVLIAFLQIAALHSIPFWVYKAFGMTGAPLIEFIGVQAALYITGAALPLPGAVGIGEGGFLVFFKALFPVELLSSAMLLSRGISFYLMLLISGIGVMLLQLNINKKSNNLSRV